MFDFVLPKLASNAFRFDLSENNIAYAKQPDEFKLKIEKGKSIHVFLKKDKLAKKVLYNNNLIKLHSAAGELDEVAICSKIK